jgi:hypothetical protein
MIQKKVFTGFLGLIIAFTLIFPAPAKAAKKRLRRGRKKSV